MNLRQPAYERATWAHHRRYCFRCTEGKPCERPTRQETRDVEVILNAYLAREPITEASSNDGGSDA